MTKIEWTHGLNGRVGRTWNPVAGCTVISPGCTNCYAMRMARRLEAMGVQKYDLTTRLSGGRAVWTGEVNFLYADLEIPFKWKKPSLVFVNSMSDLFHEYVDITFINRLFEVIRETPRHQYQVLTKRPENMGWYFQSRFAGEIPRNVWLGVSVENDEYLDRIDELRRIPAAVRFLSLEPLLGPLENIDLTGIHWVIVGGESGPRKRPVDLAWMRSIRDQCLAAGVPLFVKQIDKRIPIPDDLMIRQWPKGVEQ